MRKTTRALLGIAAAICLVAIGYFSFELMAFDTTPGEAASAPARWPGKSDIATTPGRWQLVMFVHPECSCTIASLEQLRRLESLSDKPMSAHIVLWRKVTGSTERDWRRESGGADVFEDRNGSEARIFGARTSGQTFIYDETGRLVYSGGLTVFRGEGGGEFVVKQILREISTAPQKATLTKAVFGCPITNDLPLSKTISLISWTRTIQ